MIMHFIFPNPPTNDIVSVNNISGSLQNVELNLVAGRKMSSFIFRVQFNFSAELIFKLHCSQTLDESASPVGMVKQRWLDSALSL